MQTLRIATRKSPLAVWQAEHVATRLQQLYPELKIELIRIVTRGDKILDSPLAKIGGKGLFVKELETRLYENAADIAVHSLKDVPMELPPGLHLPVIMERESPFDALVSNNYDSLGALPDGAVIGTSSLRRGLQISAQYPALKIKDLRGNINTRLGKLDNGDYDAIILAKSGLQRMGFDQRITETLSAETCLPAVGQGALGIECRCNDAEIETLIAALNHEATHIRTRAERAMNHRLNGGCQVPIAGFAELVDTGLRLRGMVGKPDGSEVFRAQRSGAASDAKAIGIEVAEDLLSQGADRVLADIGIL